MVIKMKRKHLWQFGLAFVTAFVLILGGTHWQLASSPVAPIVQAQTVAPEETPPIQPTPTETNPTSALPTSPDIPTVTLPDPSLSLAEEEYEDPSNRFSVGVLADYQVSSFRGVPLVESPDGNLAYTVVVEPVLPAQPLSPAELGEFAMDAFAHGEGFDPTALQQLDSGDLVIPWTGTLTQGRKTQPISGTILARQTSEQVLLLLISATEAQADQVDGVLATLFETLKPM